MDAFDEGRNAVARELTDLQKQREAEQNQVIASGERRRDRSRQALDEGKKKVAGHAETIQASQQQLQDAQRELNVLQTQLASLQSDRSRVAAQITTIQAQIQQLSTSSSVFRDLTQPGNPRPIITTTTQTQSISGEKFAQASSLALNLATLNKQAFDMDRKLLALQAQAAEASGRGGEGIQSREKGAAAIREAEKRAKIAERQLRKPVPTSNPRIAAINAKMTNFPTYAPFPYEQEKQRVLGWFAK
jgi:chromosome segregation ATPase